MKREYCFPPLELGVRDLRLADVVTMKGAVSVFAASVVKQITETEITLFRPYVHTDDFSYCGGVICYIGVENYKVGLDSTALFMVHQRQELR